MSAQCEVAPEREALDPLVPYGPLARFGNRGVIAALVPVITALNVALILARHTPRRPSKRPRIMEGSGGPSSYCRRIR
jgi:hypothetical protein